jgi:UDP-N-acetylglucosamine--N-acetylmuramyl-(pentapeptide) pyrophosphoryl-undecaprenol N-acetylglucosamine transferase
MAIACGGTGGHLFPGLAVATQLVKRGCEVTLLVSPKEIDQKAIKTRADMKIVKLPAVGLQRGSRLAFVRGFCQSYFAAKRLFRPRPPHTALAMGGFTSAPPILAARAFGASTYLHESNTIPGRANRWLSRVVDRAFIGFPSAASGLHTNKVTVTGTPIRSQIRLGDSAVSRAALGLDPERPVVVVMGGSQGASGINELVVATLPTLAETLPALQWFHLTGPADLARVQRVYDTLDLQAKVHPFFADMELVLGAATVAVSRAGASSMAELAALRLPAILIPFPFATDDHQTSNARAFAATGAALLLEQATATPQLLTGMIKELVADAIVRAEMRSALAQWHSPRAAEEIADALLAAVGAQHFSGTHPPSGGSSSRNGHNGKPTTYPACIQCR